MGLSETIVFYLLIGAGVAVAVFLIDDDESVGRRAFLTATAWVFWPLYLPVLLKQPPQRVEVIDTLPTEPHPTDEMATAIDQVEAELETAVNSLDGWAEDVLAHEQTRFSELCSAWRLQADRIRDLDRLLAEPEFLMHRTADPRANDDSRAQHPIHRRISQSEQARQENIERLRAVRCRLHDGLMGTLAWVRELVTMIHLAKFTGAPASRAEELVEQIAAAVEGLSEVTNWRDETFAESVP